MAFRRRESGGGGALLVLLFLIASCMGSTALLEAPFFLLFGWLFYLKDEIPKVQVNPDACLLSLIVLALLVCVMHHFARWLHGHYRPDVQWRFRWTCQCLLGVIVLFVSGIALAGVVHQVNWLARSPEPLISSGSRRMIYRIMNANNMKQIGIAVHNYDDEHKALPITEAFDSRGNQMHSWATMLLPHLEETELFESIDRDLPWKHPKNREAFSEVVSVYTHPADEYDFEDASGYALMHYAGNSRVLGPEGPKNLEAVTDGTSHTILAGEVNEGFMPWGNPLNLRDPVCGIGRPGGFSGNSPQNTQMLFLDGSVRSLSPDIDPKVLRALSTPNGGEVLPEDFDEIIP